VERENAFFKSSPEDEYHLPQMNSGITISVEPIYFLKMCSNEVIFQELQEYVLVRHLAAW
jgi:hypothetical protein